MGGAFDHDQLRFRWDEANRGFEFRDRSEGIASAVDKEGRSSQRR